MDSIPFHKIPSGCELSLNIQTPFKQTGNLKGHWIGLDEQEFILCRVYNCEDGKATMITEGSPVKAGLNWNGRLIGFRTHVVSMINKPARWLVLAYPKQVASKALRRAPRFDCNFSAQIQLDKQQLTIAGRVADISSYGAKFVPDSEQETELEIKQTAQLLIKTPTSDKPYLVSCEVVNTPTQRKELAIGLNFLKHNPELLDRIKHQFVSTDASRQIA